MQAISDHTSKSTQEESASESDKNPQQKNDFNEQMKFRKKSNKPSMRKLALFFCIFVFLFTGCGRSKSNTFNIGIDPSWYPLELAGKEKLVLAFSIELLQAISKAQKLQLSVQRMNWDNLLWGLREKKYQAILNSMPPYIFYQNKYSFSAIYLLTGPALITPIKSKIDSLEKMQGKEMGLVQGSSAAIILQKYPGILLRPFDSIPDALNALESEQVDAAVVDILLAQSYVRDLYADKLKLASGPLNDQGLRLITLHNATPKLIEKFNKGLAIMQKNGTYASLLAKWGLSPDAHSPPPEAVEAFLKEMVPN